MYLSAGRSLGRLPVFKLSQRFFTFSNAPAAVAAAATVAGSAATTATSFRVASAIPRRTATTTTTTTTTAAATTTASRAATTRSSASATCSGPGSSSASSTTSAFTRGTASSTTSTISGPGRSSASATSSGSGSRTGTRSVGSLARVVLLGHLGGLGRAVLAEFQAQHVDVFAIDVSSSSARPTATHPNEAPGPSLFSFFKSSSATNAHSLHAVEYSSSQMAELLLPRDLDPSDAATQTLTAIQRFSLDISQSSSSSHSPPTSSSDSSSGPSPISGGSEWPKSGGNAFDAVICLAGGFAAGGADAPNAVEGLQASIASSLHPAFLAAVIAAKHLKANGLLVLPGAAAPLEGPTPTLLAYGCVKTAVHSLVRSLAAPESGLPPGSVTIGLAPVMLDTAANQASMPGCDRSGWSPLSSVAQMLFKWAANPQVLSSGAIYRMDTKKDEDENGDENQLAQGDSRTGGKSFKKKHQGKITTFTPC
eukprot:GHVT01020522.1.p1 GENE.GHVT01020522.1~~GHVT01020522.1.p1  ORF type:complete len:480 (+),score=108.14 GHVT01020522.1:355-1794(+)